MHRAFGRIANTEFERRGLRIRAKSSGSAITRPRFRVAMTRKIRARFESRKMRGSVRQ